MLDVDSAEVGVILRDVEVGRQHATLGGGSWRHEEVKLLAADCVLRLTKLCVDDAATGRVLGFTLVVIDEEPLRDTLVDYNYGDLGLLSSPIIQAVDSSLKLRDLAGQHLVALSFSDTISVDDEVGRELTAVPLSKSLDCLLDDLLHFILDYFLSFLLNQEVRVVLAQLRVDACRETNDRLGACVTDINANQHVAGLTQGFGELQVVKITSRLGVDLTQDVGCLRQVEGPS